MAYIEKFNRAAIGHILARYDQGVEHIRNECVDRTRSYLNYDLVAELQSKKQGDNWGISADSFFAYRKPCSCPTDYSRRRKNIVSHETMLKKFDNAKSNCYEQEKNEMILNNKITVAEEDSCYLKHEYNTLQHLCHT